MLRSKKIKAFTLLEFLVVLSLSGIVVTLSYLVWNRAMESLSIYETNTEESAELMRMKDAIQNDFFESKFVLLASNGVICTMADGKEIEYDFSGEEMVRKVDDEEWAIEMEDVDFEVFRKHEKQKESSGLVDEIKVEFKKENDTDPLVWRVYKKYGFSDFMNKEQ